MSAKTQRRESFTHFRDSKKILKTKKAEAFTIKTKKMSGKSKGSIGQVMRKLQRNYLLK